MRFRITQSKINMFQHIFITTGNSTRQFTEITNTDIKYNVFKKTITIVKRSGSKLLNWNVFQHNLETNR